MNKLLTVDELCEILSCKKSFVYRMVNDNSRYGLPYIKLGHRQLRFKADAVDTWIEGKTSNKDQVTR